MMCDESEIIKLMDEMREVIKLTREALAIMRGPEPIITTSDSTEWPEAVPMYVPGVREESTTCPRGYEVAWGVNTTFHIEVG